jgi:hypothetical protein
MYIHICEDHPYCAIQHSSTMMCAKKYQKAHETQACWKVSQSDTAIRANIWGGGKATCC